jgi:hypothetical protein
MSDARPPVVDRGKVRAKVQQLNGTALRVWLDRAIELLPDEAFAALIAEYVYPHDILSEASPRPDLGSAAETFHRARVAGSYYETPPRHWRVRKGESPGTQRFITEHARLIDACLRHRRREIT